MNEKMNMCTTKTGNKILTASMHLFAQKGYSAVTTKEIAKEAGVSEMTVFRHFDNKHNLFAKAFDRFVFSPKGDALYEELEGDLEKDLFRLCSSYQDTLYKNQKIIFMYFKNMEDPELDAILFKFSNEFQKVMCRYFAEMRDKGALKENQDPETLATTFLAANIGLFVTSLVMNRLSYATDSRVCRANCIEIFVRGIRC